MNIIGIVVACENEIITILKSKFKLISMLDEKPYIDAQRAVLATEI